MSHNHESEYALVLDQLGEITKSVLRDLQILKTNPLLASSSTSCRYVEQIARKTEEVLQIVDQLTARPAPRRKETKSSRHGDASVPMQNILQNVSLQQYQDMENFIKQVLDVIEVGASLNLPVEKTSQRHRHSDGRTPSNGHKRHHRKHTAWCQRSHHHVVPTIEKWIYLLAEVQNKTQQCQPQGTNRAPTDTEHSKMVRHFQRLFDVPTEGGVYTRMNELYSRVGEMQNVLRSIKDTLGLDEEAPASSVVTATTRLCELYSGSTTHLLGQLLQQEQLDRVISRMEHYRRFFPIFDAMVKELMQILGVVSMDRVVPAVRALKLLIS